MECEIATLFVFQASRIICKAFFDEMVWAGKDATTYQVFLSSSGFRSQVKDHWFVPDSGNN